MAKRPKHPSHADFSQLARSVVEAATRESDEQPDSAAVIRGRLGGTKGGKARANKLTSEQRSQIARKAAVVRWAQLPREGDRQTENGS